MAGSPAEKKTGKVKLEEIFEDENLLDAFRSYLKRNLMSESFDLWVNITDMEKLPTAPERVFRFKEIAAEYFLRGCRTPINLNHELIDRLRQIHLDLQYGSISSIPADLLSDLKREVWLLMSSSCLPSFLQSDVYISFQQGIRFSSKDEYSRSKAEQFFGMRIEGPLHRCEVIEVIQYALYTRSSSSGLFRGFLGKGSGKSKSKVIRKDLPSSSSSSSAPHRNKSKLPPPPSSSSYLRSTSSTPPPSPSPSPSPSNSSLMSSSSTHSLKTNINPHDFAFLMDFSEGTMTDKSVD